MTLPSMSALRAFEALSRHLNMARAAQELNLTRSAISHQVRFLEAAVGAALLRKDGRGVALTPEGTAYAQRVRDALAAIGDAGQKLKEPSVAGRLRISCQPSVATRWLSHHIGEFHRAYPEIDLEVSTSSDVGDVYRSEIDLFIRYGNGSWRDRWVRPLAQVEFFPVCSPQLLNLAGRLQRPDDLAGYPLIHVADRADWGRWLAAAGAERVAAPIGLWFSDAHLGLNAAAVGHGIVLGDRFLAGEDLRSGRLVRLFDVAIPAPDAYYAIADPAKAGRPTVRTFLEWVQQRVQASMRPGPGPKRRRASA